MALVRTVSLKKRQPPVKSFGDLATCLTVLIMSASCDSDEVHIVFDKSIKSMERLHRGKCKEMLVGHILGCIFIQFCSSLTGNTFQPAKSID